MGIIDAWVQHPTARHIGDPIFDSVRRWNRDEGNASRAGRRAHPVGSSAIQP